MSNGTQYICVHRIKVIDIVNSSCIIWLAVEHIVFKGKHIFAKYYVKKRESNKFAILETMQFDNLFPTFPPKYQQIEKD